MKYLNILLAIILATLMVGCGSPTDSDPKDEFRTYTIGSFHFTSPEKAEYIGVDTKNKTIATTHVDTIDIYGPKDRSLVIKSDTTNRGNFEYIFADSSVKSGNISIYTDYDIKFPDRITGNPIGRNGINTSWRNGVHEITMRLNFLCRKDLEDIPKVYRVMFTVDDDSTNYHKVYNIHADSLMEATRNVAC